MGDEIIQYDVSLRVFGEWRAKILILYHLQYYADTDEITLSSREP
jgi:hypothetical protein